jgi:hypothetical protein
MPYDLIPRGHGDIGMFRMFALSILALGFNYKNRGISEGNSNMVLQSVLRQVELEALKHKREGTKG